MAALRRGKEGRGFESVTAMAAGRLDKALGHPHGGVMKKQPGGRVARRRLPG